MKPVCDFYSEDWRDAIRLKPSTAATDWVLALDLVCIIVMFFVGVSPWIMAPGVQVDLVKLPQEDVVYARFDAVIVAKSADVILIESTAVDIDHLPERLPALLEGTLAEEPVLLLKLSEDLAAADVLRLAQIARQAGFAKVLLSGKVLDQMPSSMVPAY